MRSYCVDHAAGVGHGGGVGQRGAGGERRFAACGTSVTPRVSLTAAGAAAARRPPLTAETCLRTALISSMGAPQLTSSR